jgi:hypothetical protein
MKHRYHLWLIGAVVIGSASISEARTWKGKNGNSYDTLALCLNKSSPCTPQDRVVEVPSRESIPTAVQLSRSAARASQPIYIIRQSTAARRPARLDPTGPIPEDTRACWQIGTNNFYSPGCVSGQILVDVIE